MSSLYIESLANNLSAPVGYEASMSTTSPVFLRPAMEIRVIQPLCNQGGAVGGKGWERKQEVGGIPGSLWGRSLDCVLQWSQSFEADRRGSRGILFARHGTFGRAQKHSKGARVSISSHQDMRGVPLMQTIPMFFNVRSCCATMLPPLQVIRFTPGNLQTQETWCQDSRTKQAILLIL